MVQPLWRTEQRFLKKLKTELPYNPAMEKEMATHSSILAWRIPWTEEPGGLSPCSRKESDTTQ